MDVQILDTDSFALMDYVKKEFLQAKVLTFFMDSEKFMPYGLLKQVQKVSSVNLCH